jgi:hypothetical protein
MQNSSPVRDFKIKKKTKTNLLENDLNSINNSNSLNFDNNNKRKKLNIDNRLNIPKVIIFKKAY